MFNKQTLLACGLCLTSVLALAQTSTTVIESASSRIDVLGRPFAEQQVASGVDARQSRVLIYRLEAGPGTGATSIFVNGRYHASLVKGAYSELCQEPGRTELGARHMQVGQSPKDRPDTTLALQLAGGQTQYLRVRDQDGRPVFEQVTAAQGARELPATKLQRHTISRVARDCIEAPAAVAQPARHTLPADTLFAFGRSDRAAMTSAGTAAIDKLVERLRQDYQQIDKLRITGHADPLGTREVNDRLSLERAVTVREYIEDAGLLGTVPIEVEGRGAREPVVRTCGTVATARAKACNLPNRRVVVEVSGLAR